MNHTASIWAVLGIVATNDAREIRRAYARRLKVTNPEDDAEGFRQLRAAYEHAMLLAAQVAQQAAQSTVTAEPVPKEREPEPAQVVQVVQVAQVVPIASADVAPLPETPSAAPTQEGDEDLRIAAALFHQLEVALRNPAADPSSEMRLLETLLTSPTLRRLDIHQRAESALANMFAECIPRSDHLLDTTVRFFEWDKRAHESSLSTPARQLLTRLNDVQFIASLRKMNNEYTRAYDQLISGQAPRLRWIKASLSTDPPELRVLRKLSEGHQNLLGQIPPETLRWWQEFARRPRISRGLLITGLVISTLAFFGPLYNDANTLSDCLLVIAAGLALTAGVVAFKLFAVDLPAMHIQERWRGRPPVKLALGWLPASIVLLFAAIAARDSGWPAWCVTVLAALTWLWSAQVSGPAPPRAPGQGAFETRAAQVLLINGPMFFWLVTLGDSPLDFSAATYMTIVLLLLASATGRSLQVRMFRTLLGPRQRVHVLHVAWLVVVVATGLVVTNGRDSNAKPWVVAVVIAVTLLRRASPFGLLIRHRVSIPIILLFGWGLASYLMQRFDLDPSPLEYPEPRPVIVGALVFLGGALYSLARERFEAEWKHRDAHKSA